MSAPRATVTLNSRYRLLGVIASGGMAVVYDAQDLLLGRAVAVKALREPFASDAVFVQRFRQEAQAAARLSHPNIVNVHDVGQDVVEGSLWHYMVMERVDGEDLARVLQAQEGRIALSEAMRIGLAVCEAVAHAHQRGLVHCDLKPHNVLIARDGQVKVTDFGIARAWSVSATQPISVGEVWGTPHYYAPEQAAGMAPTPASDVYSLGVLLFELLTGRRPFEGSDPVLLARLHQTQPPPAPSRFNPSIPPLLDSVVLRALAKDPAQRYRDAAAFARALRAYLQRSESQTVMGLPPVTSLDSPLATVRVPAVPATPPVAEPRDAGPDLALWLLGALAFLCVAGLVPLYVAVYQAYSAPANPPLVTTAPSLTPALVNSPQTQVVVPALVGKPLDEAGRELAALGLSLNVLEEREVTEPTEKPSVLEQRPAPGIAIPKGGVVDVVVSKPQTLREVPQAIIGLQFTEQMSQALAGLGFIPVVVESFDFVPAGVVLSTQPPPGSKLGVSQTLTLTVSTGGRKTLKVNLSPIVLESATFVRDTYAPGQVLQFRVTWRALAAVGRDYSVGWYLLTPDASTVLAQGEDRAPMHEGLPAPTQFWSAGTVVNDTYTLVIPNTLPPGDYPLYVGMYSDAGRLSVIDPGATVATNNLILLHVIRVR
ncbi:MAG: protein kinase [Anaerolineae bacterium]|nr:protein kinase [Thermoflexales bacterium]MDW8395683.1 protein kinase [Anaerolineae bacterium]